MNPRLQLDPSNTPIMTTSRCMPFGVRVAGNDSPILMNDGCVALKKGDILRFVDGRDLWGGYSTALEAAEALFQLNPSDAVLDENDCVISIDSL